MFDDRDPHEFATGSSAHKICIIYSSANQILSTCLVKCFEISNKCLILTPPSHHKDTMSMIHPPQALPSLVCNPSLNSAILGLQVAHYLILTHLCEQGGAMPMMDITNMRKRTRPEEASDQLVDNPVFKQARLAHDLSEEARHRAGYAAANCCCCCCVVISSLCD